MEKFQTKPDTVKCLAATCEPEKCVRTLYALKGPTLAKNTDKFDKNCAKKKRREMNFSDTHTASMAAVFFNFDPLNDVSERLVATKGKKSPKGDELIAKCPFEAPCDWRYTFERFRILREAPPDTLERKRSMPFHLSGVQRSGVPVQRTRISSQVTHLSISFNLNLELQI